MARKPRKQVAVPAVGDLVLIGRPGVSMPSDWFLARVLWTDGTEMLTEHQQPSTHDMQRNVCSVDEARAIGDVGDLSRFKETARVAVAALSAQVCAAEQQLVDARQAVWNELDRLGTATCRLAALHPPGDL